MHCNGKKGMRDVVATQSGNNVMWDGISKVEATSSLPILQTIKTKEVNVKQQAPTCSIMYSTNCKRMKGESTTRPPKIVITNIIFL
jgi:hypothetical protein